MGSIIGRQIENSFFSMWRVGAGPDELCEWFVEQQRNVPVPPPSAGALRIACYNVHFFLGPRQTALEPNEAAILAELRLVGEHCSVLVLNEFVPIYLHEAAQEHAARLAEFMAVELGFEHHTYKAATSAATFVTVIFSRVPFDFCCTIPLSGDREAVHVLLGNGLDIDILGTHLDVYDETGETRAQQVDELFHYIESGPPRPCWVLAGDMNALRRQDYSDEEWTRIVEHDRQRQIKPDTNVIAKLEQQGFVDCFEACKTKPPSFSTWSGRRIDYCFLKSVMWKVQQAMAHPSAASDHLPVICDLVAVKSALPETTDHIEAESWRMLWDSSVTMAALIREAGESVLANVDTVLELGCGCYAAPSLAVLEHVPRAEVTASDIRVDALELLERDNPRLKTRLVNFSQPKGIDQYDCILGSEILYDLDSPALLTLFLASAMGRCALLADPFRSMHNVDAFRKLLEDQGWSVYCSDRCHIEERGQAYSSHFILVTKDDLHAERRRCVADFCKRHAEPTESSMPVMSTNVPPPPPMPDSLFEEEEKIV